MGSGPRRELAGVEPALATVSSQTVTPPTLAPPTSPAQAPAHHPCPVLPRSPAASSQVSGKATQALTRVTTHSPAHPWRGAELATLKYASLGTSSVLLWLILKNGPQGRSSETQVVSVASGTLTQDVKKSISRTHAWETVVWRGLFRWKSAPGFPVSRLHGKVQP